MNDLPHDFAPLMEKFWGRLFSPNDNEALAARNVIRNFLTRCHMHPTDVVVTPRAQEKLVTSLVLHLEKYQIEKTRNAELQDQVAALQAQLVEKEQQLANLDRSKPTPEVEPPTPDGKGNIPFPAFLVALLAARNWQVQNIYHEFAQLAEVDQQTVVHWRERGKVPYHYYTLINRLPFGKHRRIEMEWTNDSIKLLREYFAADYVLSDMEIAKAMAYRLGRPVSTHAVHCKALKLGLLKNIKRASRRKPHNARATNSSR